MADVRLPEQEPNLLDRIVRAVSPEAYARRMKSRAYGDMLAGGYVGGSTSRRSMRSFDVAAGSADAETLDQLPTLRARSRDMRRNTPYATGALNQNVTNVVGGGIKVRPEIDREVLGLSEEAARSWERRVKRLFRAWAESEGADVTRTDDFYGLQALAFRATMESGDVLVIRRMQDDLGPNDLLGLELQLVEADRVSNPQHQMDTERLAGGVETDPNGAPLAYHVQNEHPGDRFALGPGEIGTGWTRVPAFGSESGDRLSFLLYERLRPGQSRGVPYLAPVIEPLKQLDRYSEAELDATVLSAMFTVFVELEDEWPDETGELGLPGQPEGAEEAAVGEVELGKGTIVDLAPGESVSIADPNRPNSEFGTFADNILRQVGVALEIPFEVLVAHYGESYSAARAALQQAWQAFHRRRTWLTRRFCQRVYEWALWEMVARGMVDAPGFFEDPLLRRAWSSAAWSGPAKLVIREDRQVEAATRRVEEGFSTREAETAALTGGDFEANLDQRSREEERMREAGLRDEPEPVTGEEPEDEPEQVSA